MTDEGPHDAKMYLPPKNIVAADHEWSLEEWENGHLRPACLTAMELFSSDSIPSPEKIRHDWPMVEKRAWAKFRAEQENRPATLRYANSSDDVDISLSGPQVGAFYRMQDYRINHTSFKGGKLGPLQREAFVGIDGAVVLPYDPKRDRVLLIEQLRMGPLIRHDTNPWSLEPIAGMVDARETPEDAAHREAKEEAGLTLRELEFVSANYPSPGSATDFFYCYVGLCDLISESSYVAGLDSEAEDLRVHTVSFDNAMAMVKSGEIATGPLVMLLFWLATQRDRLRASA
jgi:nudix-type nucleoside diphosphatase (YffH/AdpP family)